MIYLWHLEKLYTSLLGFNSKLAANYTIQIKVLIYTEIVELSFLFGSVTIPMTIENKNCTYSKSPEYFEHSFERETWMGRVLRWEWRENKGSLSYEIRAACFYVKIGNFSYLNEGVILLWKIVDCPIFL